MEYLEELRELEAEASELRGDKASLAKAILIKARDLIILASNTIEDGRKIRKSTILNIEELLYEADQTIHLTLN